MTGQKRITAAARGVTEIIGDGPLDPPSRRRDNMMVVQARGRRRRRLRCDEEHVKYQGPAANENCGNRAFAVFVTAHICRALCRR